MDNSVVVKITRGTDEIKMIFYFDKEIELNLSSDKIEDLQHFFVIILQEMVKKDECFTFDLEDKVEDLYHDVCSKYIDNLNVEMKKIFKEIPRRDAEFGIMTKK